MSEKEDLYEVTITRYGHQSHRYSVTASSLEDAQHDAQTRYARGRLAFEPFEETEDTEFYAYNTRTLEATH